MGQKQTSADVEAMSALPLKADIDHREFWHAAGAAATTTSDGHC